MDRWPTALAQFLQDSMEAGDYRPVRVDDEDESVSIKWIVQDPETGLHYTVEVAGI
jgi:hypothetical protein